MTPLAPPTEAEVKEIRQRAERLQGYGIKMDEDGPYIAVPDIDLYHAVSRDVLALCDAYLAQREREKLLSDLLDVAAALIRGSGTRGESWHDLADSWVARAALSAAPLAPETQTEGDG